MEKQQLIEYLSAVCDAESAVQACKDNIDVLEQQKKRVNRISAPLRPSRQVATIISRDSIGNLLIQAVIGGFVVNIILALMVTSAIQSVLRNGEALAISMLLSFIAVCAIRFLFYWKRDAAKTERLQSEEELRVRHANQQADNEYELAVHSYDQRSELRTQLLAVLDEAIQEQKDLLSKAELRLETIYNMNVLHSSCRNLVAAYQMREYLEMGICETLEGPNGAYKQYQFDVLAQKVCTSIDEMKKSLTTAIYSLQSTLVQELRLINSNVQEMSSAIHSDFQEINASISDGYAQSRAQIDAGFRQANEHLSSMNKNLAITAHNDYIEKRLKKIDAYLLQTPADVM